MKKASIQKLVAVLSIVLLLGVITPKASAASYPVPLYTDLANLTATLSISGTGIATCSGNAKTSDFNYAVELSMDLIKYDQDEIIKSWSTSGKSNVSLAKKPGMSQKATIIRLSLRQKYTMPTIDWWKRGLQNPVSFPIETRRRISRKNAWS